MSMYVQIIQISSRRTCTTAAVRGMISTVWRSSQIPRGHSVRKTWIYRSHRANGCVRSTVGHTDPTQQTWSVSQGIPMYPTVLHRPLTVYPTDFPWHPTDIFNLSHGIRRYSGHFFPRYSAAYSMVFHYISPTCSISRTAQHIRPYYCAPPLSSIPSTAGVEKIKAVRVEESWEISSRPPMAGEVFYLV